MKSRIIVTALCMQLIGCTAWRYPNWEYVRVENKVPASCTYKMQESCNQSPADCPKWFKLRATTFGANTVVIQDEEKEVNSGGVNVNVSTNVSTSTGLLVGRRTPDRQILLGEYYFCNGPKNITPK